MKDPFDNINPIVLDAMKRLDRVDFVPDALRDNAEHDRPVPIGYGQTCSQPRLVAYMTDLLNVVKNDSLVLEIGTGCGFQTALLLELGCTVCSIEIFQELAESADLRLAKLGYSKYKIRVGDGSLGWHGDSKGILDTGIFDTGIFDTGVFDACIFTCATKEFSSPILKQLKIGGRAVYPLEIGERIQKLMLGIKNEKGELESEFKTGVLFVPLLESR